MNYLLGTTLTLFLFVHWSLRHSEHFITPFFSQTWRLRNPRNPFFLAFRSWSLRKQVHFLLLLFGPQQANFPGLFQHWATKVICWMQKVLFVHFLSSFDECFAHFVCVSSFISCCVVAPFWDLSYNIINNIMLFWRFLAPRWGCYFFLSSFLAGSRCFFHFFLIFLLFPISFSLFFFLCFFASNDSNCRLHFWPHPHKRTNLVFNPCKSFINQSN